jgi:hypothetical protein
MDIAFIYKMKIYRFSSFDGSTCPLDIELILEAIDTGLVPASPEPLPEDYDQKVAAYRKRVPAHTEYQVPRSVDGNYHIPDHVGDTVKILKNEPVPEQAGAQGDGAENAP